MTARGSVRPRSEAGFSLLEIMVALAILAMSLIVLISMTTDNVRATQHARMLSAATFLARAKIAELEDQVLEEGFVDTDQEDEGDFSDEGYPHFRWRTLIERMELPTDVAQMVQEKAQDQMQETTNPMMALAGFMGGFMSTLIEPIRVGLEESVRRVSVEVTWDEPGRPERSFEVVTFMTDPAKLDLAMQAVGSPPGGAQPGGTPGQQPPGQQPPGRAAPGGGGGTAGTNPQAGRR